MVVFWLALTLPDRASNMILLWPAGTVTLEGTASNWLLLTIDTTVSVLAAAARVKVHLADT
jgi:hypothetical protein